jgi:hypothetical protein
MSSTSTSDAFRFMATSAAAVIRWMLYRKEVSKPIFVSKSLASSFISTSSSSHLHQSLREQTLVHQDKG